MKLPRPSGRPMRLAALVVTLTLVGSTVAVADDLVADGDGLAPVAASTLDLGTVCANSTTTKPVALAIVKKGGGGGGNRFPDGASVDVTAVSVPAPWRAPATAGVITMPPTWSTAPDGATSPAVTSTVTLDSGAAGTATATIRYQATSRTGTTTKVVDLPVRATVVSCDTTPPVLHLPGDRVVEATGPAGAAVTWIATASDAAPAAPVVTCDPASGTTFALGSRDVTCRATDAAGNRAEGSFRVTVVDTTAPELSGVPAVAAVEAVGPDGARVSFASPTATDLVDGSRPVECAPASDSTFPVGRTTVRCEAADRAGNTATASILVEVVDTTAPVLALPTAVVVEATGPDGASADFEASAVDLVDGATTPTCNPASGTQFALGSTRVDCVATDRTGNATTGDFAVRVVDTTPPRLVLPADATVEGNALGGADVTLAPARATDLVDGEVDVSCDVADGFLALGRHDVTCAATDAAGNTASGSWALTVVDTTAPVLTLPADLLVEADRPAGAVVDPGTATAADVVDGDVAVSCDSGAGTFPLGVTTIACRATDASGNTASGSHRVEVVDTTGPVIDVRDVVVEASGPEGASASLVATATDAVHGDVAVSCDPADGTFPLGATTVSCTSSDPLGNRSTATATVTVRDTTGPTLVLPAVVTTAPTGAGGAPVAFTTSARDLVSGVVAVTCDRASGSLFGFGDTTVTCAAADHAGNRSEGRFVVRVGPFTQAGFHQPVDMGTAAVPVVNTVKGGATVPLKFELFGRDGVEMTSTDVVAGTSAVKTSCVSGLPEDAIEVTATGGTGLRYDTTGGQFIHNWATPRQAGTCWTVSVRFVDGTSLSARFKLK